MLSRRVLAVAALAAVLSGSVRIENNCGAPTLGAGNAACAEDAAAPQVQSQSLARLFGKYYQPVPADIKPAVKPYKLPLDSYDQIANGQLMSARLGLGPDRPGRLLTPEERSRREALLARGFYVAAQSQDRDDFTEYYKHLRQMEVPIFITSDSVLHLYHINFDETLAEIENRQFAGDMQALLLALNGYLIQQYKPQSPGAELKAAGALASACLEVAGDCLTLEPGTQVKRRRVATWFDYLDTAAERRLIDATAGFSTSTLFKYEEDYSQYIPRGHYTRNNTLKRYFRAMMYLGRMTFLLKGTGDALVSPEEARRQTLAAGLLAKALNAAKLADGRSAREVWERIYAVTAFYVGLSDDLTAAEYGTALKTLGVEDPAKLAGDARLYDLFRARIAALRKPAIYSGTGNLGVPGGGPAALDEVLDRTHGFRLMGQRFVPDSYWMGRLVFPCVPRVFPRALDVMGLLGSARADEVLKATGGYAYKEYAERRQELAGELIKLGPADWNANAYWSWLYALKPLLAPCGPGYPSFMQTTAWLDKQLNAALGSWSQLRHDTILYVKQSYTVGVTSVRPAPRPPKDLPGYVEPVPEFYARVLALARMTRAALTDMKALSAEGVARLDRSEKIIERLLEISLRELRGEALTPQDEQFIKHIGSSLEDAVKAPRIQTGGTQQIEGAALEPEVRTTLVADVHTDPNSRRVLEVGTGNLDLLVVVAPDPDGSLRICAGPVFSAYEFKHPMEDRLTDEKWREMLRQGKAPERGAWTASYMVKP